MCLFCGMVVFALFIFLKGRGTMKLEGQVRIPSGCAIAAVISKEGKRMAGDMIINGMKPMHDRSNGFGRRLCRIRHLSRI